MIRDAAWLFVELLVLFVGVSFSLTLLRRRLGDDRLRSLMGSSPLRAALRGIAVGFVTPFCTHTPRSRCSCPSVMPGCPRPDT